MAMEVSQKRALGKEGSARSQTPVGSNNSIVAGTTGLSAVHMKKWYVIHTYSGYEAKVRDALQQRVKQFALDDKFGEILIPAETVTENRPGGKTRTRQKLSLPGYIFVEMEMSEQVWHLVKDTPKVTGFIGNQTPQEVPMPQIDTLRRGVVEGVAKPKPKQTFEVGEEVRVLDGAFANFTGTVD